MKTLIIGYGNIGKIYANALLKYDAVTKNNLFVLQKNKTHETKNTKFTCFTTETLTHKLHFDIVLLAVKPQDFKSVLPALKKSVSSKTIVISVMAGITTATIAKEIKTAKIVRAMPNSPIEIGMGITGFTASKAMKFNDIKKAELLLATTGHVIYFEDENLLNAVTALSGSGPAYFFYILKHMIEAGKQMGFSESIATVLVKQTMLGAFHLFNQADKTPDELIRTVASKGGTTEAALTIFNHENMHKTLIKGIKAAERRGQELTKMVNQL